MHRVRRIAAPNPWRAWTYLGYGGRLALAVAVVAGSDRPRSPLLHLSRHEHLRRHGLLQRRSPSYVTAVYTYDLFQPHAGQRGAERVDGAPRVRDAAGGGGELDSRAAPSTAHKLIAGVYRDYLGRNPDYRGPAVLALSR